MRLQAIVSKNTMIGIIFIMNLLAMLLGFLQKIPEPKVILWNMMMRSLAFVRKCPKPNEVSWDAMMICFVGRSEDAFELFHQL